MKGEYRRGGGKKHREIRRRKWKPHRGSLQPSAAATRRAINVVAIGEKKLAGEKSSKFENRQKKEFLLAFIKKQYKNKRKYKFRIYQLFKT